MHAMNDELIGRLLERPYWIVDVLPDRVPAEAGGQYPAVEGYYLRPPRREALRRKQAELLLRLNCYWDMAVSFDGGERWEREPDPEGFVERLTALPENACLRVLFPSQETLIDLDGGYTSLTVYDPKPALLFRLRKLAGGDGLFVWRGD